MLETVPNCGPVMAISSDVTDVVSSKGLLPQLTYVLHALTDSHELLLCKVRSVRLEHMSTVPLVLEAFPHAQFVDFVDSCPLRRVETTTGTAKDTHRAFSFDEVDTSTGSTKPASSDSDLSPGLVAASAESTYREPPAPSCASSCTSTEVVTPDHDMDTGVRAETPTPPREPTTALADQTGADSASCNYNFFDELDARLAHLENPETGSGTH